MEVLPNFLRSSKSLSPVSRKSALPSVASERRKLSQASLQAVTFVRTVTNSAICSIVSSNSSISDFEKKRLNFGRFATSTNSDSSTEQETDPKIGI